MRARLTLRTALVLCTLAVFGIAQALPTSPPLCTDFNDSSFHGWGNGGTAVTVSLRAPGPSGARDDVYFHAEDESGASQIFGSPEYHGNWTRFLPGGCGSFCFDLKIFVDGNNSTQLDLTPSFILVSDPDGPGGNPPLRAIFRANMQVSEDGGSNPGWHRICAPIALLQSGQLPSDASGSWSMLDGRTNSDWDTLLANVTSVLFPIDFTSNPAEEVGYDNICLQRSERCRSCLEELSQKILCSTDGSGNFTYTFALKNLSQSPVHHLFLLNPQVVNDPSRQVSFSPSYLSFTNSPLLPNGLPQTRTVVIRGAQPGDTISFLVSGLDADQDECCAVERTITLPRCDCAQLLTESGPQCRFRPPDTYNYSFTLQNLFPGQVQYVLMTPSSGSGATFGPSSFNLNPILGQNGQATLNTILSNVTPGAQTCFRIGLHSPSFEHCCSIEKCVTPPRCTLGPDDVHLVGGTTIAFRQAGLLITGFGSSGQDGVSIATGEATGFDAEWLPVDFEALPAGARLTTTFQGVVDGIPGATIGTTKAIRTTGGVELRTDFSPIGATQQRIEYYLDGELVRVETDQPNDAAFLRDVPGRPPRIRMYTDVHFTLLGRQDTPPCSPSVPTALPCLFASYTFFGPIPYTEGILFDEIRVYPLHPSREVESLSNVLIQGALLPSLTLTSANAQVEDTPSHDLSLVLNTGFNDATGTTLPLGTLPGGTADDDWRVVHTGAPAKLVIHQLPAWRTTLPGSRWISVDPNQGRSLPTVRTIGFERCFCLNAAAASAELDLRLFADDVATVLLNGQPIGGPGGQFRRLEPLRVQLTGAVGGGGPFRAGQNCLRVDVADRGVVTGLDLVGSVKAAHGTCDLIP